MGHQPRIHVTFPVLNEEAQLADAVDRTASYCSSNGIPIYEFCIADNGSTDQTPQIGRMLEQRHANVRYLRVGRRGFGLALKSAWANTDADIVGYMDVDLATDLRHLKEVSDLFSSGAPYDLVLGSRLKQGASVENRSLLRELMSRGFNRLLQWRLGVSFSDAMCGFKFIDRKIYNALVNSFDFTDDWFFATQLAVRAEWIGARIFDMPVEWTDQPDSKSSARLLNLSLLYLAGISELRQEMQQFQKRLSETIPGQRGP